MDVWTGARGSGHPLEQLDGKPVGDAKLEVSLGPKTRFGANYFQAALRDKEGAVSQPVVLALYHSGPYPSYNWIEIISIKQAVEFPRNKSTLEIDLQQVFDNLSALIPPGGHIMSEYESDQWAETRRGLGCGIPPVATQLGYMLFKSGCGIAFKDWYFAEGGVEGPRKLQGYKALSEEHRRERSKEMISEIKSFVHTTPPDSCSDIWETARSRAGELLTALEAPAR